MAEESSLVMNRDMINPVKNRRSLTPDVGIPAAEGDAHGMRRGGPRREVTERVHLLGGNLKTREGWALNVSRGGVRVILEERVELGEEYDVTIGIEEAAALNRKARVVWLQEEPDGFIVGMEFLFKVTDSQSLPMMSMDSHVPPPPTKDD
jgi:PilZ domain